MGILQSLISLITPPRKKPVAPFQVTSAIPPQENYAGYTTLPNLPMGSEGDFVPDPYRLHAPFQVERENRYVIAGGEKHFFDEGDPSIIRIPDQDLQSYFNQKKTVDPQVILVPANGVFVPDAEMQPGYKQQFVPSEGMREDISGAAPHAYLSQPIMNVTKIDGNSGKRAPIVGAKAPKPKKG